MKENHMEKRDKSVVILGYTGGVGTVVTRKCFQAAEQEGAFTRVIGAARNPKPEKFSDFPTFEQWPVDARDVNLLVRMLRIVRPDLLINVGVPYWNMNVMEACLRTGTHYMDTACYEPEDEARIRHDEQWDYHQRYEDAGLIGLIGCGFDPGVTNAMVAYALKKHFSEVHTIDIMDCNGGSHGKTFASNFNLAVNLREVLGRVWHWNNGQWVETPRIIEPGAVYQTFNFEEIGPREMYLLSHEEVPSMVRNLPQLGNARVRFWMTFGNMYLKCASALEEVGMTSIRKIRIPEGVISPLGMLTHVAPNSDCIKGHEDVLGQMGLLSYEPVVELSTPEISPLEFLQMILPEPSTLGATYTGKTNISCLIEGLDKSGKPLRYRIINICDHVACYEEVQSQAISYTTGVPAMVGATGIVAREQDWFKPGVFNVEQLNPEFLLDTIDRYGLPLDVQFNEQAPRLAV